MMEGEDVEIEVDGPELDVDDLEDDSIALEDDFAGDDELAADGSAEVDEDFVEDADLVKADVAGKKVADDDDDDDDLRTEDDVEADLDAILREKLTAAEEVPLEDDEEEVVVDDKTDGLERLQPRRPDEIQCTQCFLLVRKGAPGCPVEDDACPLFVS
jgi:hypothetical protein